MQVPNIMCIISLGFSFITKMIKIIYTLIYTLAWE